MMQDNSITLIYEVKKTGNVVLKTTKVIFRAIFNFFMMLIHCIINLLSKIVANPIVFLIIFGAIFLLGIVGVLTFLWKINAIFNAIRTDIRQLIAPIIRFALETDNPAYADDTLNTIGNIVAYLCIVGISIFEKNKIPEIQKSKQNEQKQIEEKMNETISLFFGEKAKVEVSEKKL